MKIIHSRLLLALSALLLAACSQPKDKFIFEGKIAGIQQAEFYVYSDDGALSGVDTIRIDDGKFSYECQLTSPAVLTLLIAAPFRKKGWIKENDLKLDL